MSVFTRESTADLSGNWQFLTDPNNVGIDEEWYEINTQLPAASSVEVPHTWQEHEELHEFTGTAWYRRQFSFEPEPKQRTLLRFGGVDYEATVWVNGTQVGSNRGGYLPFVFDVTDELHTGENTVVIRVHDPDDLTEIPHGKQGSPWYTRVSGIWQDVSLSTVPETYITTTRATPDLDSDTVDIAVEVAGDTENDSRVRVSVTQNGRPLGSNENTDNADEVTVALDKPEYWTPETPALCDFEVELIIDNETVDTVTDYFGMRSVTVEDGDWYLNGECLRVRGALDQAYYPSTQYWPDGSISYREEIETAKDLGFNMLRKHIKPAHPEFVELADHLGILVWEEPANPNVFTERSKREVQEQFKGMVNRDYNRPSVIVWSLYNEEWGIGLDQHNASDPDDPERLWHDEDKQEYLSTFYRETRELDPTRLICDNSGWAHVDTDINDYHEYFIAPDRVDAWRDKLEDIVTTPDDNYATTTYDDPETTPIVMSEFGTWGLPDVERLREYYGGDPPWFDHDFLTGLKRPVGIDDRFAESALSDVFDDLSSLATAWQRRELASIKTLIRDMRITDGVSGYVITEFSDIEWEFNGILDYLREPKNGLLHGFSAVNAPITGWAIPDNRVQWDDDALTADLVVANDTPETATVTLEWEAFGWSDTLEIEVAGSDVTQINDAIDVALPSVDAPRTESITVHLLERDLTATTEIAVVPRNTSIPAVTVATDNDTLAESLTTKGYELTNPNTADVTVRTGSASTKDAGNTLVLPDRNGKINAIDDISLATLPEQESWNLCACFVAQTLFEDIDVVPGWAFEDLYPYAYVDSVSVDDTVDITYAEGWIANSGAISLTRESGDKTLGVCSLRIADRYGDHPMATAVLDRLLEQFA